ncbi:MAG: nuclear transport factor 2 family protein [Anaeromyxobacter sp.]
MNSAELEVLEANAAFYRAFAQGNALAMSRLWSEQLPVACIHPGWDVLDGREEVLESWRQILEPGNSPEVACSLAEARVLGDVAYVTCRESIDDARLAVTNVFAREGGGWRLVLHQATPIAPGQARPEPTGGGLQN